jgi:hypothetical protein
MAEDGFTFGGWSASSGMGAGVGILGAYSSLYGVATPGIHKVTYHFFWPEGCVDSVSLDVRVKAVPQAPHLFSTSLPTLEASLVPNATAEWKLRDSLFAGPALYIPTTNGTYSVRQTLEGCTSAWSNSIALTITEVRPRGEAHTLIYPNPASDILTISVENAKGSLGLDMLNAEGKTVLTRSFAQGDWEHQISVQALPKGVYTVLLSTSSTVTSHRVLVQ